MSLVYIIAAARMSHPVHQKQPQQIKNDQVVGDDGLALTFDIYPEEEGPKKPLLHFFCDRERKHE